MPRCSLALVLLLGCGSPDPISDAGASDAAAGSSITLGEGTSTFVPLADGADVELVAGPQGGWHLFTTARLEGVALDGVTLTYEVTPVGATTPLGRTELLLDASDFVREGARVVRAGDFVILDITTPSDVVGMEVDLTVEVQPAEGAAVRDARRVRVVDDVEEPLAG